MYFVIGVLVLCLLAMAVRLFQYKRQMRTFASDIKKRMDTDHNQPVSVDYFGRDVVALAEALNGYADLQREQLLQYERDRRYLKNLIAGISHDFRTPLTAAAGYMQLLEKSGNLSEKDREYLDIAIKKITYLKLLSDDFFEISSLEAKEEQIEVSRLHVGNFLSECILQQYDWMEQCGLRTDFCLPSYDVFVMTNAHYLKRILENLFSNARKYAQSYTGMRVICEEKQIVIVMENDFAQEMVFDINRVFEPFYRSSARSNEGCGLGLYVVKFMADRLGYEVQAECEGGLFRFRMFMQREMQA